LVLGGCTVLVLPTLPAHVTVAAIVLPSIKPSGPEPLTTHSFVFHVVLAISHQPSAISHQLRQASRHRGADLALRHQATPHPVGLGDGVRMSPSAIAPQAAAAHARRVSATRADV
jgi:hypothetical protein